MVKTSKLDLLLGEVFDEAREGLFEELQKSGRGSDYEKIKRDFVFHMTDWVHDLKRLQALEDAPDVWSRKKATTFLIGFLYHVVPHLNAAGRLLLDQIPDAFADDETARLMTRVNSESPP